MKIIVDKWKRSALVDWLGLIVSGLCFVHCWIMPVMLLFLPGLIHAEALVHPILGASALLSSAFILTCHKPGRMLRNIVIFSNVLILVPLFFEHGWSLHVLERTFNTTGSVLLMFVHYFNLKQCRNAKCN